jgi:hypothetical protein
MKKTVLTFGLISGAVSSAMMLLNIPLVDRIGFDNAELIGYTTIVLSFLLVFFGVRSYRDTVAGGALTFGRALGVGLLITLVSCACYVATWQLVYYRLAPDFGDRYAAHYLEQQRAAGATAEELATTARRMEEFKAPYRNPVVNAAITFLEPFPIGLAVSLITAGVLRRRSDSRVAVTRTLPTHPAAAPSRARSDT